MVRHVFLAVTIVNMLAVGTGPAYAEKATVGRGVGQFFPDFVLPDLNGGHGSLSDYRGKKILLINFASW